MKTEEYYRRSGDYSQYRVHISRVDPQTGVDVVLSSFEAAEIEVGGPSGGLLALTALGCERIVEKDIVPHG